MDALNVKQASLAGFDWGAGTADIVAALWPDRVRGIVSVSGYLTGSQASGMLPLHRPQLPQQAPAAFAKAVIDVGKS